MGDGTGELVYDIQFVTRLDEWIDQYPAFDEAVMSWRIRMRDDPHADDLTRDLYPSVHNCAYAYPVPNCPLVVVVLIEEAPDEDGITWIWIHKLLGP